MTNWSSTAMAAGIAPPGRKELLVSNTRERQAWSRINSPLLDTNTAMRSICRA